MPARKKPRREVRTRAVNKRSATTNNVPCTVEEKKRWQEAARHEARALGLSSLPLSEHTRRLLDRDADGRGIC